MNLKCTETFERTSNVYYDMLSDSEYKERLKNHLNKDLPGLPSKYRYRQVVSMGGSRSSKSYSILQMLMVEMIRRKNIKITVWRNTKVTCKSSVMEDFQKIISFDNSIFSKFKENKQSSTFTYKPTGSKIIFTGADDVGKVLGSAQDISFFNEVTEFNKDVYLQITQRTSDRVICDYNPSKDFWLESYRYDKESVFIHSDFRNNFYCPPNIVKQLLSYEPWETGSYEVKGAEVYYNNKIVTKKNQPPPNIENVKRGTAHPFNWMVYGLGLGSEKPDRIYHGWNKITKEYFDSLEYISHFGLDFGTSNPTACIEVKFDGDNNFYIKKRLYKPLNDLSVSLPTVLKRNISNLTEENILVCDSAKLTYIDILLDAGFLAIPAIKGPGSIESGISTCQSVNIYYVEDKELENEYTKYSFSLDRYNKATEVPVKKEDHLMDALRYIITYMVKYYSVKL